MLERGFARELDRLGIAALEKAIPTGWRAKKTSLGASCFNMSIILRLFNVRSQQPGVSTRGVNGAKSVASQKGLQYNKVLRVLDAIRRAGCAFWRQAWCSSPKEIPQT